jgi:hypothetical protein
MDKTQFDTFIASLMPAIVEAIMNLTKEPFEEVTVKFYKSKVYQMLGDETSKLWRFSPLLIAELFNDEQTTGNFDYPEAI